MSSMPISSLTKEKISQMLSEGKRFDSRGLLDFRDLSVDFEVSNKAEGSARVKLGLSEVIVGVKLAPGTPYPDSPDKGNLMVSGDFLPLASPRFESGPPGYDAIELPRLIDRAIRESGMIDLSKLVITPGEKVWTLFIDVYPINDDGNLIDLASIGAIAALKNTKIPVLTEDGNVDHKAEATESLVISEETAPISFSFFKIGSSLVLDPTREEQESSDARITFGISKWKDQYMINSCQKYGEAMISQSEVDEMMSLLPSKLDELSKKFKSLL